MNEEIHERFFFLLIGGVGVFRFYISEVFKIVQDDLEKLVQR